MHNYRKRIAGMIRQNGLWNGLFWGIVTSALGGGVLYWLKYQFQWQLLVVMGICILVWVLFFLVSASGKIRAIKKRIASLENTTGIDLDDEEMRPLTKELLAGRSWLVYRRRLDYKFWTKPIIEDIDVHPKSFGNTTVITIKTKGQEEVEVLHVTSRDQLGYDLHTWFYQQNGIS